MPENTGEEEGWDQMQNYEENVQYANIDCVEVT